MATPGPMRPRVVDSLNPYSSKVVKIVVGPQKVPFSIHKAKLEMLPSFFDIHGGSLNNPNRRNSTPSSEAMSDAVVVALSEDVDVLMKTEDGEQAAGSIIETEKTPDYTIVGRFHTVGALKVLTSWLYNENPKTPASKAQCKHLLQAYVLARQYSARFRDHHSSYNLDLDNPVWLANRIADSTENCSLTAYFVEQAAFEIVDRGHEEFDTNNMFFKTFLVEGHWSIRLALFKALAKHAQASGGRLGDPAQSKAENWHVEVAGENAGKIKTGAKRGIPVRARRAADPEA